MQNQNPIPDPSLWLTLGNNYIVKTYDMPSGTTDNIAEYEGVRAATDTSNEVHYFKAKNGILLVLKTELEQRVSLMPGEHHDLFQMPEHIPAEVQAVLDIHNQEDNTYENCGQLVKDLNIIGYTCEYYLDAEPYGLRALTPAEILAYRNKLIAQFMGYEAITMQHFDDNGFENEKQMIIDIADCKYSTSWDWIMPVIQIIETLDDADTVVTIQEDYCTIWGGKFEGHYDEMDKLASTFLGVTKFIEWYNFKKSYEQLHQD